MKLIQTIALFSAAASVALSTARAATIELTNNILSGTTSNWTADNTYVLKRVIYVESNAVLNIAAGTVIKAATGTNVLSTIDIPNPTAALWVARGAKINAQGCPGKPIIFTIDTDDVNNPVDLPLYTAGQWGGVVLMGNAQINTAQNATGNTNMPPFEVFEGTTGGLVNQFHIFGGTNDADSSGVLKYVSIRYPGTVFAPNRELNGLTLGAVGSGTTLEHIEVFGSSDDGFEWFGGNVNSKYLVSAFCEDDSFDTDQGYRGENQFWFGLQKPGASGADKGFEIDGDLNQNLLTNLPISQWTVHNCTLIGRGTNIGQAVNPRDETAASIFNSIITEFNTGLFMETDGLHFYATNVLADFRNNLWNVLVTTSGANGGFLFSDASRSNVVANPLLVGVSRTNDFGLDPRPAAGSPALTSTIAAYSNAFYTPVNYLGAFGPGSGANWLDSWTGLFQLGVIRNNLEITSLTPGAGNVTFDYTPEGSCLYLLERASAMGPVTTWTPVRRMRFTGESGSFTVPVDGAGPQQYYRLRGE